MAEAPRSPDALPSLSRHAAAKGHEVHAKYGPHLGWHELQRLLDDRTCVRYPCEVVFDSEPLQPGELAHTLKQGRRPEEGFRIYVHPCLQTALDKVTYLVLYQLVLVNYGPVARADDAETFGAAALGLSQQDYYEALCQLADAKKCP